MRISFLFISLFIVGFCSAQNLIPNGDLENGSGVNFFTMLNWDRFQSTPDAYTGTTSWGSATTTNNTPPQSGFGYVGFYQYGYWGGQLDWYEREYIVGGIPIPLTEGNVYQMEYWVKPVLVDIVGISYAVDQIGALFTSEVPQHDSQNIFSDPPQVDNGGTLLNDLSGWTRVSDCFTAQGGEQFVTMGNFQRDEETNAQPLAGATQPSLAYYLLDNVSLVEVEYPSLPSDTSLCSGDSFQVHMSDPNASYTWPDGTTGSSYIISSAGSYYVDIDINGCVQRKTMYVAPNYLPNPMLRHEAELCTDETLILESMNEDVQFLWSTGSTSDHITVNQEGVYWVEMSNDCGLVRDSVHVLEKDCSCYIYLPNSFSPNEDGVNDSFGPVANCELAEYEFQIIDRWGQVIFRTSDPELFWNGGGISDYYVPDGIYTWLLSYRNVGDASLRAQRSGSVTVIR